MAKQQKENFVCVEWGDASFTSGYYDPDDQKRFSPIPAQTVGHLIKKDHEKILVVAEKYFLSDGTIEDRHVHTIPRKMIKRIRYLGDK